MVFERTICYCGASAWLKVLAWVLMVFHTLNAIGMAFYATIVYLHFKNNADEHIAKFEILTQAIFFAAYSILTIVMFIILLIGTYHKRLGYIKAWLIFGGVSIAFLGILFIYELTLPLEPYEYTADIVQVALTVLCFVAVYIHNKDIKGGVFYVHPKLNEAV